jgi:hypothetical protein
MKKISMLAMAAAAGLCGCEPRPKPAEFDDCEKIAAGKIGDYLVKCPKTAKLEEAARGVADSKFLSVGMDEIDITKLLSDKEHIYVNILPEKLFGGDAGCVRVMVPGGDINQLYSVQVCDKK